MQTTFKTCSLDQLTLDQLSDVTGGNAPNAGNLTEASTLEWKQPPRDPSPTRPPGTGNETTDLYRKECLIGAAELGIPALIGGPKLGMAGAALGCLKGMTVAALKRNQ